MEQENIQERSVLSIDCHRPFIQVTAKRYIRISSGTATTNLFNIKAESFKL
nr:hypothetical protein [Tanacetum cinerariifolium]